MNYKLLEENTTQLLVVDKIEGYMAKLSVLEKINSKWVTLYETNAFVGREGITTEKREGDYKTPLGLYKLTRAFGIKDNPNTKLDYYKVTKDDVWVDDINSPNYNTMQQNNEKGEILYKKVPMYHYSVIIEYNTDNIIPGKGSAIFLHVHNNNGTAGCVAVSEEIMIRLLKWLDRSERPYIYITK